MEEIIQKRFTESSKIINEFGIKNKTKISECIALLLKTLKNDGKIMVCGNGGSAADAQHLSAELSGRFKHNRKPLPAIALTTNTSAITAIGNDFGFELVFERQVEAFGKEGDALIAISTSGNSKNVINAVKKAKERNIKTIGFLGKKGGELKEMVDIALIVESDETPRIQECHEVLYHTICEEIEKAFLED